MKSLARFGSEVAPGQPVREFHIVRDISSVRSLEDLRAFVHQELCRFENLLIEQFQLSESRILRNGELCGLQFMLQGPRNVRLNAVWAADNNDLYFYNTRGERFAKLRVMTPIADQLTRAAG